MLRSIGEAGVSSIFRTTLLGVGLVLGAASAASAQTVSTGSDGIGESQMDRFFGEVNKPIPIEVPAFHGIEPKLTLSYRAGDGADNGWVGAGWSLAGLSVIKRASPGFGAPRYDASDVWLLDGIQLIPCATGSVSPSCTTGGTHSTVIESYARIKWDATAQTWTVTAKNGTRSVYQTAFVSGGQKYLYLLTSVIDSHANAVTYTYAADGSNWMYPASITYNGNSITFYNETRSDLISAATGLGLSWINKRLKAIQVKVGTSTVRAYQLNYGNSNGSSQSVLTSVVQHGKNATVNTSGLVSGGTPTLPIATLSYNTEIAGFATTAAWGNGWCAGPDDIFYNYDFNGDGKDDLYCYTNPNGYSWVALSNGNGTYQGLTSWATPFCTGPGGEYLYIGDYNGDGKADLHCYRGATGVHELALSNGDGSFQAKAPWGNGWCTKTGQQVGVKRADLNGDGKADMYCYVPETQTHWVALSNGDGTFNGRPSWGTGWCSGTALTNRKDFNGDGKADLYCNKTAAKTYEVALSNGDGTFVAKPAWSSATFCAFAAANTKTYSQDYNGDGRVDISCSDSSTGKFQIAFSTGSSFVERPVWIGNVCGANDDITAADFNGDGRGDLHCYRKSLDNMHYFYMSRADGTFVAQAPWGGNWCNGGGHIIYTDSEANGDGRTDLLCYNYYIGQFTNAIYNSSSGFLLSGITDQLGGVTTLTYAPATAWPAQSPCPAGSNCRPAPKPAVQTMTVADGRGGTATTSYSYSGALTDPVNRRFLGFRYAKTTLPCNIGESACPYIETTFKQDYGSVSKPDRVDRRSGTGVLLASTIYQYTTNGATQPYLSQLTGQWQHEYSGGTVCPGANCKRTFSSMVYDAYGNITSVANYGDYDSSGDETTTTTTFVPNVSSYIVSLPALLRVYSGLSTTTKLSETQFAYDQPGAATPNWNLAPSKGDATQKLRWLNTNNSYVTTKATYDSWGNALTTKDELDNTTTKVYDATYRLYPISTTNALNQTHTQTWDVLCGKPLVATGLNGSSDKTTVTYDHLCRETRVDTPLSGFKITSYVSLGSPTTQHILTETPSADGSGNQWTRAYMDGLGRTWRTTAKGPTGQVITQDTSFHKRGQVASSSEPYYSGTPKTQSFVYDQLDRLVSSTNFSGSVRSVSYGLWSKTETDELLRPTTSISDAYGRLKIERVVIAGVNRDTSFSYDLLGNQTSITDAEGNRWTRVYDSLSRMTSDLDPDRGTWTYAWFANGWLQSQTDAKAQTTIYANDNIGRKISESVGTVVQTWTYDQARAGFFNLGRLTSMSEGPKTSTFDYDLAGRQVKVVNVIP